jgi:GNAT superfamily N-acetyltransferase
MESNDIVIKIAKSKEEFTISRDIILEYVQWLGIDLSFQNFDNEINALEQMYSAPSGGLLIVTVNNEPAGVAGIRQFENHDCELKRMFVRQAFRGLGLGKALLLQSIALAKRLGYKTIKLDTADYMKEAIHLYKMNGFVETSPYRYNPHTSAKYFELTL